MNSEELLYPWLKDPVIKKMQERIEYQDQNIQELMRTVQDLSSKLDMVSRKVDDDTVEAIQKARDAYRRAESVGYEVDDLRRKIR